MNSIHPIRIRERFRNSIKKISRRRFYRFYVCISFYELMKTFLKSLFVFLDQLILKFRICNSDQLSGPIFQRFALQLSDTEFSHHITHIFSRHAYFRAVGDKGVIFDTSFPEKSGTLAVIAIIPFPFRSGAMVAPPGETRLTADAAELIFADAGRDHLPHQVDAHA